MSYTATTSMSSRTTQPMNNFEWEVKIDGIVLDLGVDEISGLGKGTINNIEWRGTSSAGSPYKDNYSGLVTTPEVTFRGLYMRNMDDLKKLQRWFNICCGLEAAPHMDRYKTITITPAYSGRNGGTSTSDLDPGGNTFELINATMRGINFEDISPSSPNFHKWEFTVNYKKLIVGGGE